jgi:hypothetical protein
VNSCSSSTAEPSVSPPVSATTSSPVSSSSTSTVRGSSGPPDITSSPGQLATQQEPEPPTSTSTALGPEPGTPSTAAVPAGTSPPTTSAAPGDPADSGSPSNSANGTSALDQNGSQWFATFCSAVIAVADTQTQVGQIDVADSASMQSAIVGLLTTLGGTFSTSESTLAALAPPSVTAGTGFAADVLTAFDQYGVRFTHYAEELAAADSEDTNAQAVAVANLNTDAQQVSQLVAALNALNVSDGTRSAIHQLPSCRTLQP